MGTAIVLTTHYMEEAELLCDRVAVMHRGVIAAIGTPAELKAQVGPDATPRRRLHPFHWRRYQ